MNILLFLIILIKFVYSQEDVDNRCIDFSSYCPSWYSTITFILSDDTTEDEWKIIKSKANEVYKNCTIQEISINFFAKNAVMGQCFGENDCKMLLNNLTLAEVKPNITYHNFWNDLISLYKKNYNQTSGLAGYIITNIECDKWYGTETESLFDSSRIINNAIQKYNVIFNIIQIMNQEANRKCDFTSILKESSSNLNIMTVDNKNLHLVNASLYGICYEGYNEFKLDNWPKKIICSSNENDFKNCKNWTYSFYIALSPDTSDDDVEKTKLFVNKLIKTCDISGSHVYLWTSETSNKGIPCDPSLGNNCEEAISGLCLYDMIYSRKSPRQLDIKSMKVARWSMNNPIGEGVALFVISNLKENEFYETPLSQTFLDNSWYQGYFYYTNHVVARIFDIGKVLEKRNNNKTLITIKNASNLYFDIVSVNNFDELLEKSNMTVCKAKLIKNNSSLSINMYSNIYLIMVLLNHFKLYFLFIYFNLFFVLSLSENQPNSEGKVLKLNDNGESLNDFNYVTTSQNDLSKIKSTNNYKPTESSKKNQKKNQEKMKRTKIVNKRKPPLLKRTTKLSNKKKSTIKKNKFTKPYTRRTTIKPKKPIKTGTTQKKIMPISKTTKKKTISVTTKPTTKSKVTKTEPLPTTTDKTNDENVNYDNYDNYEEETDEPPEEYLYYYETYAP
ncbi:Hypothetical protein SRAE_2000493800 [Strongyloides ratti]|uniref:Uncharacterized protein n=1 Tax=Strongyloides ratti TaxID=34506 RepID=A0A090N097_STRRB|nr:Hypothetical protein SRAE_2000493800 [Strongyloides ratti]CEF70305.1 Hypothetical protein SRAE_2000493800 [Strongyloides ratti]